LDVRNPSSPVLVGRTEAGGYRIYASGERVYLHGGNIMAGGASVRIVDVSDPTSPTVCGYFGMPRFYGSVEPSASSVLVHDGLIYAAMGWGGLWVLHDTGPRPPWTATRRNWKSYD